MHACMHVVVTLGSGMPKIVCDVNRIFYIFLPACLPTNAVDDDDISVFKKVPRKMTISYLACWEDVILSPLTIIMSSILSLDVNITTG